MPAGDSQPGQRGEHSSRVKEQAAWTDYAHRSAADERASGRPDPIEQEEPARGAQQPTRRQVVVRDGHTQRINWNAKAAEKRPRR